MNNEQTYPPILFVEHMAEIHGVAVRTLYNAMKRRSWPYSELPKIGRKARWSRDQVFAIISAGSPRTKRVA